MSTMRDAVAREIWANSFDQDDPVSSAADAAITTVLTMLAAEFKKIDQHDHNLINVYLPDCGSYTDMPDWILSFLPSQPEVK